MSFYPHLQESQCEVMMSNGYTQYDEKEINGILYHCNKDCGITVDCDFNGASNILMLLIKMIQNEK